MVFHKLTPYNVISTFCNVLWLSLPSGQVIQQLIYLTAQTQHQLLSDSYKIIITLKSNGGSFKNHAPNPNSVIK